MSLTLMEARKVASMAVEEEVSSNAEEKKDKDGEEEHHPCESYNCSRT